MKHVASFFSGSNELRPGVVLSVITAFCLLLSLAFITGCGDDEDSVSFPSEIPQEAKHWLFSVGGTDANNVYACGRSGAMFHFNGLGWSEVDMGTTSDIVDIKNIDGTLYAVGHKGKIWNNTGSSWNSMTTGTSESIFCIGEFQDEIYAGGYDGTLLELSGSTWNQNNGTIVMRDPANGAPVDTLRMDRDIFSLITIGDNFVGGAFLDPNWEGPVFGMNGTKGMSLAEDVPLPEEESSFSWWLRPLSGAELIDAEWIVSSNSNSLIRTRNFLGTSEGYLFRMQEDGNWAKDDVRYSNDRGNGISDMYLAPGDNLYIVTNDGLVVLRENDGTRTVLLNQGEALSGIWGTDSSNMYIVGYMEDEIYHAVHHAGADTLEITVIPVVFPGDKAMTSGDGIARDQYHRPIHP